MKLLVKMICFLLKLCSIASFLVLQESSGYEIAPSSATFADAPSIRAPESSTNGKHLDNKSSSPNSQPNGSPLGLPHFDSAPVSQGIEGFGPSLSPNTPQKKPHYVMSPLLSPEASVQIAPAPKEAVQNPPGMPQEPPSATPVASPASKFPRNSQAISPTFSNSNSPGSPLGLPHFDLAPVPQGIEGFGPSLSPSTPQKKPPYAMSPLLAPEASVASPASKFPRNSQMISPTFSNSPSNSPVSPISTHPPSTKGDRLPVSSPPNGTPNMITPLSPSPEKVQGPTYGAPPPVAIDKYPPRSRFPPVSSPSGSFIRHPHANNSIFSPAPSSYPVPHPLTGQGSITPSVPVGTPLSDPNVRNHGAPHTNPSRHRTMPVSAPVNVKPKQIAPSSPLEAPLEHKAPWHSNSGHTPILKAPSPTEALLPADLPPAPSYRHRNARASISIAPPPYYAVPPRSDLRSNHRNPGIPISPAPLQSPPAQTNSPSLSPKISPQYVPRNPIIPFLPTIQALPPPPPNEDCASITCNLPFTNTPPGSPCGCVLPMQIGLRLTVALYTFFPLVSELALEISAGVFIKPSQVRIMGANAASQDPDKTIVFIDLVPFGDKFDNTTAFLISQRFWQKQVILNPSLFGDYEVLYVQYPGLPPSPPSSVSISEPYPGGGNTGGAIKPIGVDVHRLRHSKKLSDGIILIIVLSSLVAAILCCAIAWVLLFRRRNFISREEPTAPTVSLTKSSGFGGSMYDSGPASASQSFSSSIATYTGAAKTFSSSEIEKATDKFNASRILGEGGFGRVYSGMLEDGTEVSVKVLKRDDQQGGREFLAEVEMLSRLHHRNLVKLIGICTEEKRRCLVYELIPNGSVDSHLHGIDKEIAPLDWGARVKIALGAARALAYLHEDSSPRVIHRDFKSSNILLEHDFTPKVSDFGLARSALDEENRHISTRVMGTFGYVAPEYAMTGHLLVKSDVYSYGVVLLELLTGRKPVDMSQPPGQENLVSWARPLLISEDALESIIDPSLGPDFPYDSIAKVAAIASMCVQPEVSHRPFMGEVVQALKLVSDECEKTEDLGSRSFSQEDLSIDYGVGISAHAESEHDVERGLPLSDMHGASGTFNRLYSGRYMRHSSSGPLRTGRRLRFWERMKMLSGGTVSEHVILSRQWPDFT